MYSLLYLFWGILPASLFLLALWGAIKRAAKQEGREYSGDVFKQGLYCLLVLLVAVWIDQNYLEEWVDELTGGEYSSTVPRFLLYPALLLITASIGKYLPKSNPDSKQKKGKRR